MLITVNKKIVLLAIEEVARLLEKGWTTNVHARDENDTIVSPYDKKACKWCITGAIFKVTDGYGPKWEAVMSVISKFIDYSIIIWNDDYGTTQEQVIMAVRFTAIAYKEGLIKYEINRI